MKAYGLALHIQSTMGLRVGVYEEDEREYVEIRSHLDADRLKQLQDLVEMQGWEVHYRSYADDGFLSVRERG